MISHAPAGGAFFDTIDNADALRPTLLPAHPLWGVRGPDPPGYDPAHAQATRDEG